MPDQPTQKSTSKDPMAGSRGYTLSVVLVMMTVVAVFCLKGRLYEPTQLIREREAELIYRGEHLARGIAAYRQKTGRYPLSLEEVDNYKPRLIRQIYKDPMTEHGGWSFIYNVPTAPSGNNQGLPITGVRSRSQRDSIKTYKNKSLHSEWEFSALDPALGGPQPGQQPGLPGQQGIGGLGGQSRPSNRPGNR